MVSRLRWSKMADWEKHIFTKTVAEAGYTTNDIPTFLDDLSELRHKSEWQKADALECAIAQCAVEFIQEHNLPLKLQSFEIPNDWTQTRSRIHVVTKQQWSSGQLKRLKQQPLCAKRDAPKGRIFSTNDRLCLSCFERLSKAIKRQEKTKK